MLHLESKHFLADHNLPYTDKLSMAAGVEVRVPLLDPQVVALAARLPIEFKQRGSTGKWILRKAFEGVLPASVLYRPKTGFGAPLRRWMHHQLRPLMDELLSDVSVRRRGLFNPASVNALRRNDERGCIDATYPLFSLACIELWCRQFVDAATPRRNVQGAST